MTTIESSKLLLLRVQKAVALIESLRGEVKEWKSRFSLVENHNHELQELLEKLTTDQTAINEANLAAISALDATLGEDFDDLALEEIGELEDYAADDEDIEEFDVEDEE